MKRILIGAIAALLLVLGMGVGALGETLTASTFDSGGLYFIQYISEAILGGWDSSGNFYIAGGIIAGTAQEFYAPTVTFGYDAGSAISFATADTTGVLTITQAGSGPTTAWTVPVFTSTNSTSNTTYTPSNVVGFDAGSSMTTAVADTSGFATITHTGNATGFGWTATTGSFTCATSLTNLTPSYVVGFDAGSLVTFAVADTTGGLTVTHTGNATALAWTAATATWTNATSSTLYTPSYVVGFDAGSSMTVAVADTSGFATISHAGNATGFGWTATTGAFTCATSLTNLTPSYIIGFDAGSAVTFAVADTTGAMTITHAGNATAVTWTATNFDFVGAMAADAVTVSDVLTFSDAGTIDNTAADTLSITETNVAIVGEASISGDLTLTGGEIKNVDNAGAVVAGTCTAVEYNANGYHKTVLTLLGGTTFALEDKDDGGGIKIYDFPEGQVIILGTQVDATITLDTNVTAPYVMAVGTVIGVDSEATLTTTEANFVASTAVTNGVAQNFHGVSAAVSVGLTGEPYNGTGGGLDLFVNAAIAAGSITGAGTLAATGGTITVWWLYLGDY